VKFKRSNKLQSVPNLTPLIDVVFLLLIFFMVSTSFSRETRLLVSLPEADGEVVSSAEAIEVLVTREGNYAINGIVVDHWCSSPMRRLFISRS